MCGSRCLVLNAWCRSDRCAVLALVSSGLVLNDTILGYVEVIFQLLVPPYHMVISFCEFPGNFFTHAPQKHKNILAWKINTKIEVWWCSLTNYDLRLVSW